MLEQFTVENFKGFEKLTLEDLGHINIFVGKNNTGKTSLLQAVALNALIERVKNDALKEVIPDYYQSLSDNPEQRKGGVLGANIPQLLFEDLRLNIRDKDVNSAILFRFKTENIETVVNSLRLSILMPRLGEIQKPVFRLQEFSNPHLIMLTGEKELEGRGGAFLDDDSACFLPSSTNYKIIASENYDYLERDEAQKIISLIQNQLEPNLEDIQYGKESRLKVFLKNGNEYPIESMGDGFSKLLGLMTMFYYKEIPVLCIDEPENGFHYSVQSQFWQLLATAGLEHGKQSFIATHSYELLESLNTLLNENPDLTKPEEEGGQGLKVRVYELQRVGEHLQVVKIDQEVMSILIKHGSDFRG